MARYDETLEISFIEDKGGRSIIPDAGASITVEYWNGLDEWIPDAESPITQPSTIFSSNVKIKLTPTGGGFWFDSQGKV